MQTRKFLSETSQKRFLGEHWSEKSFFGGNFRARKVLCFWGGWGPKNLFPGDSLPPEKFYMSQYILRYMTVLYQSMYRKVKSEK